MKLLYKLSISLALVTIMLFTFSSCEEDANFNVYEYPEQTVTGISPSVGYPGINVTITGKDFGVLKGAVKVYFGTILATVVSCEDTKIVVQVPAKAVTADVTLKIWTHDSGTIGTFTTLPAPEITSVVSANALNPVALAGTDIVTINGVNFGTDASKVAVSFNGTAATIQTIADNKVTVLAPANYATGFVSITMGGLTIMGTTVIVNPNGAGDLTPYFLSNTGNLTSGGGFVYNGDAYASNRWGTVGAPWITNTGAKNKSNGTIAVGGFSKDGGGRICWETWTNTPVVDGKIYQVTALALSPGTYTVSFSYYSENHPTSSVYCVVAAGTTGLPSLANLSTALGYAGIWNSTPVGVTVPNSATNATALITQKFNFTLATSQKVSIGFLANMTGATSFADYCSIGGLQLVKN